jgi:hypothetical protein
MLPSQVEISTVFLKERLGKYILDTSRVFI